MSALFFLSAISQPEAGKLCLSRRTTAKAEADRFIAYAVLKKGVSHDPGLWGIRLNKKGPLPFGRGPCITLKVMTPKKSFFNKAVLFLEDHLELDPADDLITERNIAIR